MAHHEQSRDRATASANLSVALLAGQPTLQMLNSAVRFRRSNIAILNYSCTIS
ncbi:hypothetical protein [Leptolyngbya sp. Cla-17]|uniref:hypothetical protein n=1 Tax=Leptolyngbya sp. Cla-17 TaxID=2803751 RepID=UPI00149204F8|nr:hypothetical protein [Leptolyngbya sp. Cla-17]